MRKLLTICALAIAPLLAAQTPTPKYLPAAPGVSISPQGFFAAKATNGTLNAGVWSTSNNGIALSLTECQTYSYACQILAPASYAQTEQYNYQFWQWANGAVQQYGLSVSGAPYSALISDYRFGGVYQTAANPTAQHYPGATNVYAGFVDYVPYSNLPSSALNNTAYVGRQISQWHFQGGYEQMTYPGGTASQSSSVGALVTSGRNTAEAQSVFKQFGYAYAPGDLDSQEHLSGPGGFTNASDEGVGYHSDTNDETPDVPYGTVSAVSGDTVTVALSAYAGTQGERRYVVQTASPTALTPSAVTNQVASPILGSTYGHLSSMTFSSVPTSSGWGTLTAAVAGPTPPNQTSTQTVAFSTSGGTAAANTLTCIVSEASNGLGYADYIYPSSVAGGYFTAAWTKNQPVGALWFQGGDCGKVGEIVADTIPTGTVWNNGEGSVTTTHPVMYPWMVVGSIDGVTELFATPSALGPSNSIYGFATRWGNSGYSSTINFYPALEAISVVDATGNTSTGQFTFNVPASTVGFSSSQAVEESQPAAQEHSGGKISVSQYSPGGSMHGEFWNYLGRFSSPYGGHLEYNLVPLTQYNYTPFQGTNNGGPDTLPMAAYYCAGPWGSCLFYNGETGAGAFGANALLGWFSSNSTVELPIARPNNFGVWSGDAFAYLGNAGSNYNNEGAWDFWINNFNVARIWSGGINSNFNGNFTGNIATSGNFYSGLYQNYVPYNNNFTVATDRWDATVGSITQTAGFTDPYGGTTATKMVNASGTAQLQFDNITSYTNLPSNTQMSVLLWMTGAAGGETTNIGLGAVSKNFTLSTVYPNWPTTPQCATLTTTSSSNQNLGAFTLIGAETIYVAYMQVVQGGCPAPAQYAQTNTQAVTPISLTTSQQYDLNGNAIGAAEGLPGPLDSGALLPRAQECSGTYVAGDYCDGGTHAWTALPTVNVIDISSCRITAPVTNTGSTSLSAVLTSCPVAASLLGATSRLDFTFAVAGCTAASTPFSACTAANTGTCTAVTYLATTSTGAVTAVANAALAATKAGTYFIGVQNQNSQSAQFASAGLIASAGNGYALSTAAAINTASAWYLNVKLQNSVSGDICGIVQTDAVAKP